MFLHAWKQNVEKKGKRLTFSSSLSKTKIICVGGKQIYPKLCLRVFHWMDIYLCFLVLNGWLWCRCVGLKHTEKNMVSNKVTTITTSFETMRTKRKAFILLCNVRRNHNSLLLNIIWVIFDYICYYWLVPVMLHVNGTRFLLLENFPILQCSLPITAKIKLASQCCVLSMESAKRWLLTL